MNTFSLKDLRFNPFPPPIKGGREFSKNPKEVFLKIEDILCHYALGNISYEHALQALNYAKNAIIPKLSYSQNIKEELINIYNEAIVLLKKLRTKDKVKEWLLSNGPPRKSFKSLDLFLKN